MSPNYSIDEKVDPTTNLSGTWLERGKEVLFNTYVNFPVVLVSGNGCYVKDINGKTYLDFMAGVAVNSLGHQDPDYVKALSDQLKLLNHCSNIYSNTPAIELAEKLVKHSGLDKVFFCNSGSEAIEAALKLSRKFGKEIKGPDCCEILSVNGSFHGRTYGALSVTQAKYHAGFEPMLPACKTVPFNDFAALKAAVTPQTCAIIIEPIQGESGIHPANASYLKQIRQLCTEQKIVLIFDEVQCGIGRTGTLFAYQDLGIEPDVLALAKGLGGGMPIGAIIAKNELANILKPGDHGCTFGGNPLACSAAIAVLNKVLQPEFLPHVISMGEELRSGLLNLKKHHPQIIDVRGKGLMQAVELNRPVRPILETCLENGLLLVAAGPNAIRFVPPLIITANEIKKALEILDKALKT